MKTKREQYLRILVHAIVALYGVACLWLFYQQSVADLSVIGSISYQSDLPLHISMIVEDGWYYSFTAYAYKILHFLFDGTTVGIALMLAVVSVATVYVTEQAVCYLCGCQKAGWTLLLAMCANLIMPIYVESAGAYRYVSYQAANIWHNSTYLCMKLFALMTFLYYLKLAKKYREGITVREWLVFAVLNMITTGIKPSFLLAFAPIMGIFLLIDLFKKVPLKQIFVFGSAMLPSGAVVLWQNAVLFGTDTGNGITFNPWYTFSLHADRPKVTVILSVVFCGIVILATLKDVLKDKIYLYVILMAMIGFLEALCLVESGNRSVDGNFLWGYSFCLFVLFLYTAIKWLQYPKKTMPQKCVFGIMTFIYGVHLYCGIQFFIRLVCGEGYWMMR